jgi:hypothetical protein
LLEASWALIIDDFLLEAWLSEVLLLVPH